MNELIQQTFDYVKAEIATRDQAYLEKRADEIGVIQERVRRTTVEGMFKVAEKLQEAHDKLAHYGNGTFGKWVEQRCLMTRKTAYNMMNARRALDVCETVTQTFDVTACYALTADSCPEEALGEAKERAEKGEQITAKVAREIIASHTEEDEEEDEEEEEISFDLGEEVDWFTTKMKESWCKCPGEDRRAFREYLKEIIEKELK